MLLYIIRHGQTEWNKLKRLQGQSDIPLNENGIKLAKLTGEGMKDIPLDYAYSSPLSRAKQTAECVIDGRNIPLFTDRRIIEISFGEWEGEQITTTKAIPPEFVDDFYHDPARCKRPPKGETFADVKKRTKDFYEYLLQKPEYQDASILVSTHGAAGRCFLANFFEDKDDIWRGCIPPNCSVSIVEVKNGKSVVLEQDKIFYEQG